jgi:flagellar hook-associated protein 3 FlgL
MRTTIEDRFKTSLAAIQIQSKNVADEQVRLSGGKRLLRASDSPLSVGRSVDMRTTLAHLDSLKRLQDLALSRMTEAESAMADAARVLDDLHQLWATTQNGSLGPSQLRAFQLQAKSLQEELQSILKRKDAGGYALFDPLGLEVVISGGTRGVDPSRINTVGSITGLSMLNKAFSENGGLDGAVDLDEAIAQLTSAEDSLIQQFVQSLGRGERPRVENGELLAASQAMTNQRIGFGANQSRVERARQQAEDVSVSVQTALSAEVDTDYASSSMEVQKAKALLEAAQTITAQIGSMNLFQKLG